MKEEKNKKKKAPTAGSWKPGQSGNPNGRPKKGQTLTDLMREMMDEVKATDDGKEIIERKREFLENVFMFATMGEGWANKLIWNYLDGMPTQKIETKTIDPEEELKKFKDAVSEE